MSVEIGGDGNDMNRMICCLLFVKGMWCLSTGVGRMSECQRSDLNATKEAYVKEAGRETRQKEWREMRFIK